MNTENQKKNEVLHNLIMAVSGVESIGECLADQSQQPIVIAGLGYALIVLTQRLAEIHHELGILIPDNNIPKQQNGEV